MLRFKCTACDEWHEGVPGFGSDFPLDYLAIPESERALRCELTPDTCVIDGRYFFARGCIEIPVQGESEPFVWGAWVSLSSSNFESFKHSLGVPIRAHIGPFFGWLSSDFLVYPETEALKTMLHLRDNGVRPLIEIEPTDYPLAVEQRSGISVERVAEIYAVYMHGREPS
jgi:hypothetical protein